MIFSLQKLKHEAEMKRIELEKAAEEERAIQAKLNEAEDKVRTLLDHQCRYLFHNIN